MNEKSLSEYPKYTKTDIFCTEEGLFRDVDIGNLFLIGTDLYIRMNYPAKRLYPRNCVIISSEDPGLCGCGLYLDSHDEVEIVTESSINLRGVMKL